MTDKLYSIKTAARAGIKRLRLPVWATLEDHITIDILEDGTPGPWVHLWCPANLAFNGRDPIDILRIHFNYDKEEYVEYTGPLEDSAEYLAARKLYDGYVR